MLEVHQLPIVLAFTDLSSILIEKVMEMLVSNATLVTPSFGITDVTEGVIISDEHVSVLTVDLVSSFEQDTNINEEIIITI